jgi:hypothetical protein
MNKYVLVAAGSALSVALIGFVYYTLVLAPKSSPCTQPRNHCIKVTVEAGVISVDVTALSKKGQGHKIFWHIDNEATQDYKFPEGGIAFKTTDGKDVFNCDLRGDYVYRCMDRNWKTGKYEYAVKVTGSPTVPPLDPWIVNQ